MTGPLMNARELIAALGISKSTFYVLKRRRAFQMLEVSRPLGTRRYSRLLVERYQAAQSMSHFGERRSA